MSSHQILIFEDVDGDGKFDRRTVFIDNLNLVCGLEIGFGGVWVGAAPYLLFIPIKPGEDKPAGPAPMIRTSCMLVQLLSRTVSEYRL